ncbi:MAG: PqqD family peptide modification chaperone [Longimicrobiales bacterium]
MTRVISMQRSIALEDVVVAAQGQVAADVGGEVVILNLERGEYFGLNAVGSRIWELIREPRAVLEVRDQLLLEYVDVDSERCTADLLAVLNEMLEASLVERRNGYHA